MINTTVLNGLRSSCRVLVILPVLLLGWSLLAPYSAHCAPGNERVDFESFRDEKELTAALRQMFPEKTTRARLEEVLVKLSGAISEQHESRPNVFYYKRKITPRPAQAKTQWSIQVMYYRDQTVRQMWVLGTPVYEQGLPDDRGDAGVFRFEDYDNAEDLVETLRVLFPLYTPKTRVEEVLVKWAHASAFTRTDGETQSLYRRTSRRNGERVWDVTVSYLSDGTVYQIWVDGSPVHKVFTHTREDALHLRELSKNHSPPTEKD